MIPTPTFMQGFIFIIVGIMLLFVAVLVVWSFKRWIDELWEKYSR